MSAEAGRQYPDPSIHPAPSPDGTAAEDSSTETQAEGTGTLGLTGLLATCCICMEAERVRTCFSSEKMCIVPIVACLVSLGLCIAGLKWVFVDKIFEYEAFTHLDPKRIGQDPVISADQITVTEWPSTTTLFVSAVPVSGTEQGPVDSLAPTSTPFSHPSTHSPTSTAPFLPSVILESFSSEPIGTKGHEVTQMSAVTLPPMTETNLIVAPGMAVTKSPPMPGSSPPTPGSGHGRPCNDSEKLYCVNGGQCFIIDRINKISCKCEDGFTGERCRITVPMRVFIPEQAEELYQKRVLTITGICIALLVVGIMCVVAYCKTKKQRRKLHERLRQSLRSERSNMVNLMNGPHHANLPADNVQLSNQYILKHPGSAEHVIERESETSFSTSHYTSTSQHSTTVTQTPSHSWSTGQTESLTSDRRSVLVSSSIETSTQISPNNHRGRLNGIASRREMHICMKNWRETPDSLRDSPHSERFVSAMTTPARMSPADFRTPTSPKSPDSVASPPVSSLTISIPSVAISPFTEEERPLLLVTPPKPRGGGAGGKRHEPFRQQRSHTQDSGSFPPSPLRSPEDDEYETTQEYELVPETPKKGTGGRRAKRTKAGNGQVPRTAESESHSSSGSCSSDSEMEDERIGEDTPFLSLQNALATGLEMPSCAYRLTESRTNSANRYSAQEVRLSGVIANQDPIAV